MADHQQQQPPPAPPPMGQGLPRAPGVPNEFGLLVKRGFGLGVGIWLAFAALSALTWFVLIVLFSIAISS